MAFEPMNHIVNGDGVTAENYNKIIDIYNATGKLVRTPVDNSQANQTGEASIEISGEGTFVAKNLKGAGGDPAWVRYAKNEAGLDMSATPTPQTKFIGFYSGSVASTNPKDYTWSKYVGKEPSTIILQGQNFIITWDDSTTTTVAIDVSNCKTTEPVSGIVTSVNGQEGAVDIGAISTIFESDKTTVKNATKASKSDLIKVDYTYKSIDDAKKSLLWSGSYDGGDDSGSSISVANLKKYGIVLVQTTISGSSPIVLSKCYSSEADTKYASSPVWRNSQIEFYQIEVNSIGFVNACYHIMGNMKVRFSITEVYGLEFSKIN